MNNLKPSRFDPTYYKRYVRRNRKKVQAILESVDQSSKLLDIGCNHGYVVKAFFDRGLIDDAEGIDLDISVVDPELLKNENFSFFQGNILDFHFEKTYDAIIFNSVFHHIFGTFGKDAALKLWDEIIDHSNRVLIFETGVLTEMGEHYWKDEFLKHYSSDENILQVLLMRIGPRLKKCEKIASLPIHWTRRPMYKIELYPIDSDYNLKKEEKGFYKGYLSTEENWVVVSEYQRTQGSKKQRLLEVVESPLDGELVHTEASFFLLTSKNGTGSAFGKKILNDPFKKMREFFLLKNVKHRNVVRLLEVNNDYGFVFPYYNWQSIENVNFSGILNAPWFAQEIISFFRWASLEKIVPGILDINPVERGATRTLLEIVDLHPCNFLVKIENNKIQNWVMIDLEYAFNQGSFHNEQHLHKILKLVSQGNYKIQWVFFLHYVKYIPYYFIKLLLFLYRYSVQLLFDIYLGARKIFSLFKRRIL
jgi:hypothetical protein